VAADSLACLEAGATIVHTHIADIGVKGAEAAEEYAQAFRVILKERPDAILYGTGARGGTVEEMLERRGFRVYKKEKDGDVIRPAAGQEEEFYSLLKKYSFRLFLRDVIQKQDGFRPEELARFSGVETVSEYTGFLEKSGIAVKRDGEYALARRPVKSFGATLEWFVAEILAREYAAQATAYLCPTQRLLADHPDLAREAIAQYSVERLLAAGHDDEPAGAGNHNGADAVEHLYVRAKPAAAFEVLHLLSSDVLEVEFGVTADAGSSPLRRVFEQRGLPLLSSQDPLSLSLIRTVNRLGPAELIERLRQARAQTIALVAALADEDLDRRGNHPLLGEMALEDFVKLIYRHDKMHMRDVQHALRS
jgi:hypothetical protein